MFGPAAGTVKAGNKSARRSFWSADNSVRIAFARMEHAARRFARRTLLVHAALLAAVLATVAYGGRQVYRAARDEVLAQAASRQRLLAAQTARGIENHYVSILTDMDLLRRADVATSTNAPGTTEPRTSTEQFLSRALFSGRTSAVGPLIAGVMWRQLQGRVTELFSCDRSPLAGGRATPPPRLIGSDDPKLTPDAVLKQSARWLAAQQSPSVGEFQRWGDFAGNLVVVPLPEQGRRGEPMRITTGHGRGRDDGPPGDGPPPDEGGGGGVRPPGEGGPPPDEPRGGPADEARPPGEGPRPATRPTTRGGPPRRDRTLVAVVSVARVERDFLRPLNDDPDTAAWLIDQRMAAMAASHADLVGTDMRAAADPSLRGLTGRYQAGDAGACAVIDHGFMVGGTHFDASMVAAEPVVIANQRWELFVATSLESVDGNVNRLFRRAVGWAAGVSVAVAGILASTAAGLIRGRVRVERLRHDVLTRELAEARRIQLAWLPKGRPAEAVIDVAAVNSPANHISGDFYNWFDLPDGRLAVTIGDVTGHGMSAAFLMATTQLLVRTTLTRLTDPGACLAEVNRHLCVQAFNGQFVTMLVAVVDPANLRLELATAGHPSPLLTDGRDFCPMAVEPQLVLGVDHEAEYTTESHDLPAGAGLLLYTDGVVECPADPASTLAGLRFGTDRLRHALAGPDGVSARGLIDQVVAAVDAFRGRRELDDDLTVVAVRLAGRASG